MSIFSLTTKTNNLIKLLWFVFLSLLLFLLQSYGRNCHHLLMKAIINAHSNAPLAQTIAQMDIWTTANESIYGFVDELCLRVYFSSFPFPPVYNFPQLFSINSLFHCQGKIFQFISKSLCLLLAIHAWYLFQLRPKDKAENK